MVTEHIKAGKLRALAVTTPARSHLLPQIPPMKDFLPGYRSGGFFGIGAPKGTPADIVNRLNRGINAGLDDVATKARFTEAGVDIWEAPRKTSVNSLLKRPINGPE